MKNNPDNRNDNVEKIKKNIDNTLRNMEMADEMIVHAPSDKAKKDLSDKNKRREHAVDSLRHEIKDEADFQDKK